MRCTVKIDGNQSYRERVHLKIATTTVPCHFLKVVATRHYDKTANNSAMTQSNSNHLIQNLHMPVRKTTVKLPTSKKVTTHTHWNLYDLTINGVTDCCSLQCSFCSVLIKTKTTRQAYNCRQTAASSATTGRVSNSSWPGNSNTFPGHFKTIGYISKYKIVIFNYCCQKLQCTALLTVFTNIQWPISSKTSHTYKLK